MNIVLCYRDEPLGTAWRDAFDGFAGVEVRAGNICHVPCDAVVSPANSFGFMDGGLDHLLSERFGWELEKQVQAAIQARPMRELLVGEAIIVATEDAQTPMADLCADYACAHENTHLDQCLLGHEGASHCRPFAPCRNSH